MCVSMSVHVTAGVCVCVPMCDCRHMDATLGVEVREQLSGDDSFPPKVLGIELWMSGIWSK